jgi:hypothetical protein
VNSRYISDGQVRARIEAEFREMPGLSLTVPQARQWWPTDRDQCAQVLADLADAGVLQRTVDGRYCRQGDGDVCRWRRRDG